MSLKSELEAKAVISHAPPLGLNVEYVRLSDVLAIVVPLEKEWLKNNNRLCDMVYDKAEKADLLDALCEVILTAESIRFAHGGEYVWTTIENQMDSEEFETPLAAIENLVETFKKEKE